MFLCQVLDLLRDEGLPATQSKILHAIRTGRVTAPPTNHLGFRIYGPEQLVQIRKYLRNPPRPGRPSHRERVAAEKSTCVAEA